MLKSYTTTFLFTLTNPLTVFAFITVFAALGLANGLNHFSATVLALGVFMGSMLWFVLLNSMVTNFKEKVNLSWSMKINKITGSLIIVSGLIAMVSLL
jgi:threonine/homoserine/homoserine lactone efflux protein